MFQRTTIAPVFLAVAAAKLAIHLPAIQSYGYFRDELYYLASTEHLHWGYVDHPPLSIAILALIRTVFGDSLVAVRVPAVLFGVGTVLLTGILARQLGGGRFAQGLAALTALFSPMFLGTSHVYSMNAIDLFLWTAAAVLLLRALHEHARPRDWILLGIVLGLGLLNKLSVLWLGGGILLGLILTGHRRHLLTPWPWLAGAVAAVIVLPHVLWQVQNDWPTREFIRNATATKMVHVAPGRYLLDQILSMNPGSAPVWLGGILFGLLPNGKRGRVFVWIYLGVLVLLLANGRSRTSYLAPAYPMLLALGSVAMEQLSNRRPTAWLRPTFVTLIIAPGITLAPFAIPLLPVDTFVRYQSALGLQPSTEERHAMADLPQHYADMFGWDNMVQEVAKAFERLSPEERERCRVFGQNYGEAGAIDVLGRRIGLPSALSGHNSYWLWGPGNSTFDVLIVIGGDREDNAAFFEDIEVIGQTHSDWSMLYERNLDVWIGRRPRMTIEAAWPLLKHYN